MQEKAYRGKYCVRRNRNKILCRALYVVNVLLLVISAAKAFSEADKPVQQEVPFFMPGVSQVEPFSQRDFLQERKYPQVYILSDTAWEG